MTPPRDPDHKSPAPLKSFVLAVVVTTLTILALAAVAYVIAVRAGVW